MVSAASKEISRKRKRYGNSNYRGYRAKMGKFRTFRRYNRNARIGGFLGLERKFLDCAWNAVSIGTSTDGSGGELQPSTGCTDAISVPAQGDTESQRDGRKYTIKSVYVSGAVFTSPLTDQADAAQMRGYYFALVLDQQANGATLASEDVFINPTTTTSGMLPQPLRNLQQSRRYRVLDSCYIEPSGAYVVPDGTATGSISLQAMQKMELSWKGSINVQTKGTTANISSVTDNAIHVVAYAAWANETPVFSGKSRIRFIG